MNVALEYKQLKLKVDLQGAAILEFSSCGIPVLQTAPSSYTPDECGGFPLLPMANRVKEHCYIWRGTKICLDRNSVDGSEYLHGQGWQKAWRLVSSVKTDTNATLQLELDFQHPTNGYSYKAVLIYQLTDNALHISICIEHQGNEERLYGLGFHPYFYVKPHKDQLCINAAGYFPEIEGHFAGTPELHIPQPFNYSSFQPISDEFVNHCYFGFNGLQLKRQSLQCREHPQGIIHLESDMPYLMMYHLPAHNFIALEPQSHQIDGCHLPDLGGLKVLKPPFNRLQHSLSFFLL